MVRSAEQTIARLKEKALRQSIQIDKLVRECREAIAERNAAREERDLARGHASAYQKAMLALFEDRAKVGAVEVVAPKAPQETGGFDGDCG